MHSGCCCCRLCCTLYAQLGPQAANTHSIMLQPSISFVCYAVSTQNSLRGLPLTDRAKPLGNQRYCTAVTIISSLLLAAFVTKQFRAVQLVEATRFKECTAEDAQNATCFPSAWPPSDAQDATCCQKCLATLRNEATTGNKASVMLQRLPQQLCVHELGEPRAGLQVVR